MKRTLLLLLVSYAAWGQKQDINNEIKKLCINIPIFDTYPSIIKYVEADTTLKRDEEWCCFDYQAYFKNNSYFRCAPQDYKITINRYK